MGTDFQFLSYVHCTSSYILLFVANDANDANDVMSLMSLMRHVYVIDGRHIISYFRVI
jgi:hypothetical protein